MSAHSHADIEQEDDKPNVRFVLGVAVATMVVFSVGIAWSVILVRSGVRSIRPEPVPIPAMIGHSEIGIVEQPMFERNHILRDRRAAKEKRLGGYGWTDRENGRIHIPIDEAMKRITEEPRP